jgi:hypothetical protein
MKTVIGDFRNFSLEEKMDITRTLYEKEGIPFNKFIVAAFENPFYWREKYPDETPIEWFRRNVDTSASLSRITMDSADWILVGEAMNCTYEDFSHIHGIAHTYGENKEYPVGSNKIPISKIYRR